MTAATAGEEAYRITLTPELSEIPPPRVSDAPVTLSGEPIPPQGRILLYSSDEWEEFIREWATGLETDYVQIKRFGGSGDKGADIAAFKTNRGLLGAWDCFQGKHYVRPLTFSNIAPEILKIFLGVLGGSYILPDSYQFVAPKGCGTSLNMLLSHPIDLRAKFIGQLATGQALIQDLDIDRLTGVRDLAHEDDFTRFKSVEIFDAIEVHSRTRYHAARFGAALSARPAHQRPPENVATHETRYVEQLIEVYRERHPEDHFDATNLAVHANVGSHFQRQRESFYKAESLRLYARDAVPPGTFEKLQDDVYSGVVDVAENDHPTGYARLTSVLSHVGSLDLNRHTLISVSDIDDRKGICHQLANADTLRWVRQP